MKKVMIVDDELDILYGLQLMLDWESLGLQVSAMCLDGYEALEMCKRSVPDILITDIRMAGMNGLLLGKHMAECYPNTRIIFLTSYSDYEYMQTAIDIKASAYLLKPVDENKLKKAVLKAAEEVEKLSHATQRFHDMETYHTQASAAVLFTAYAKLISGSHALQDSEQSAVFQSIAIHKPQIMIAREDGTRPFSMAEAQEEGDSFFKTISIGLRNRTSLLYSEYRESEAAFVISSSDDGNLAKDLRAFCGRTLSDSYSTIISDPVTSLSNVREQYLRAKKRLRYDVLFGRAGSDYCVPTKSTEKISSVGNVVAHLKPALEQAILSGDGNQVEDVFCDALESIRTLKDQISEAAARTLIQGLDNHAVDVLEKKYHANKDAIEELQFALMLTHRMDTLEGIVKYSSDQISNAMEASYVEEPQAIADILKPIILYLQEHFPEQVSLEGIAKRFHLNPSYLSRIFHRSMGINYAAFVTNLRIQHAKKLLSETDRAVSEISQACGYNSEPSFYSAFRKAVGCAPGEYRKKTKV